jgi:quercetin dioxygenase-like cupin family protein
MGMRSNSEAKPVEMLPGVVRRSIVHGEKTSLHELQMSVGAEVPLHTHPHEQTGYVASGRVIFELGGEKRELRAGDAYSVPGEVLHGVVALEDSVCVDIFSPVRSEYLEPEAQRI